MSKRNRKQQPRMPRPEKGVTLQQFVMKVQRPGLNILRIEHDDWCAHWRGKACNCNPNVKLVRPFATEDAEP